KLGMHRYHFFTNRYEYFYSCTCRYRVPIPILLRFGLHESAINLEADFILSSADYVKPIVQNEQKAIPSQKKTELSGFNTQKKPSNRQYHHMRQNANITR